MEDFLSKAMKKLNTTENTNVVAPQKADENTEKLKEGKDVKTTIPSNKNKIRYKQQQLTNLSAGGMQNGQQE